MKRLRAAVIGVGYLGKFHAQKYAMLDDVELVGVVDVSSAAAQDTARSVGCKAYTDYKELFGKIDIASIVVPTPYHFEIGKECLCNDIDIILEKPMTATLEEADKLIKIANEKGRYIQVGHLERYNPAVVALKGIVKTPMFVESHRLGFYKERGTDVSVVLDLMIHDIDIILNFVKSDVKTVHAAGTPIVSDHVDIANVRLEFENGCIANITASRVSSKIQRKIRLFQKDAYASVDFANKSIEVIQKDSERTNSDSLIPGLTISQIPIEESDALEDEIRAFTESVKTRTPPKVSGQVGREALKVAFNVMEQINTATERWRKL